MVILPTTYNEFALKEAIRPLKNGYSLFFLLPRKEGNFYPKKNTELRDKSPAFYRVLCLTSLIYESLNLQKEDDTISPSPDQVRE